MSYKVIEYDGELYPHFQSTGNAMRFIKPFAEELCKGVGYDVGCNRIEWGFNTEFYTDGISLNKLKSKISEQIVNNKSISFPIDPVINGYDALNFPSDDKVDYIISSHCLEHLDNWVDVLDYWYDHIRDGGVMFLYLPDFSQKYWRPWNNRKHKNILSAEIIKEYMIHKGMKNIFVSGVDLNNSFCVVAMK